MEDKNIPTAGVFQCRYKNCDGEAYVWRGKWQLFELREDSVEMAVSARGYEYWLIVGRYVNGHYVCIPEWDSGSALATLDDFLWNYEHLTRCMEPVDAVSVLKGLQDFAEKTGWGHS